MIHEGYTKDIRNIKLSPDYPEYPEKRNVPQKNKPKLQTKKKLTKTMAKLDLNPIFTGISGKLSKDSKITTRTRNGISHAYEIRHPFQGDPSQSQLTQRSTFSDAVTEVSKILQNPELRQHWQSRYNSYRQQRAQSPNSTSLPLNAKGKPYSTLRGFIIASLSQQ